MNQQIRKFLIDRCIEGKPVFYEVIARKRNLDLSLESDRDIFSKILGDISAYEYEKGRPLISSIAIYKESNDHGYDARFSIPVLILVLCVLKMCTFIKNL